MAKNNVKALEKFTSEELRAEIARRENVVNKWGFVEIDDSDAEDGDNPVFGIVTIEEWEKTGAVGDYSLGHSVSLPDDFVESYESHYEYRGPGGVKKGKDLLAKAGFKYLGVVDI